MLFRPDAARPAAFALVADDFGMTEGVSRAILQLVREGRLTGAGVMANMPWAAPLARELAEAAAGRAEIGLHLNLTLGSPMGDMPGLAAAGALPDFGALAKRALTGGLSGAPAQAELRAEIDRQIEAFRAAFGRLPDYVDGHQHVQVLPGVRSALLEAIGDRPGWRPWLRDSGDGLGAVLSRGVAVQKALVIAALSLGWRRQVERAGLTCNRGFSGVSPFDPARDFAADFARFLLAPGPRHLVMCHPGHIDAELRRLDPVVETREQEFAFLSGDGFTHALADAHLALTPLGEIS
jgi:hypothetical protein